MCYNALWMLLTQTIQGYVMCIERWKDFSFTALPLFTTDLGQVDGEVQFVPSLDTFGSSLEKAVIQTVTTWCTCDVAIIYPGRCVISVRWLHWMRLWKPSFD